MSEKPPNGRELLIQTIQSFLENEQARFEWLNQRVKKLEHELADRKMPVPSDEQEHDG